jgi:MFS family permease
MVEVHQGSASAEPGDGGRGGSGIRANIGRRQRRLKVILGPVGLLPLALLVGLSVTQGFDVAAFGVLAPEIRHTFHLDNAGIDAVTGLTAAAPVMCSVFLGYLGDRGSRLRLTVGGACLWGVAAILTGLAPVLAVLVLARLVGGVGLLATQTIYPSLISDYYPPEGLAQIFAVYLIGSTALGLMGSPLAGAIGSAVGWRPTFVVLAVPTFLFAALAARYLTDPARHAVLHAGGAGVGAAGGGDGVGVVAAVVSPDEAAPVDVPVVPGMGGGPHFEGRIRDGFRAVGSIRTLRRTWMAAFLFGAGTIPLATLVSNFFHDVYHIGSTERGYLAGFVGLFGLVGIVIGGQMARRLIAAERLELFPIFSGLCVIWFGAFILIMAQLHGLYLSFGAACLLALGAIGYLPAYITFVALLAPARLRSQAYAWSLFFYASGAICLSGVIGAVADADGQRVAMSMLAGLVAIGGVIGLSASRLVRGDLDRLAAATS